MLMSTRMRQIMRLTHQQRDNLVDAYLQGATTLALEKEYGISHVAVCGLLSRRGILKNRSQSQRKYPLNESIFQVIDDEATAYWLGFLAADGYIYKDALSLRIASTEIEHIQKFRGWI